MKRYTEWGPTGAALKLNNPQNAEEARRQLMEQWAGAVHRLAMYEDIGLTPEEVAKLARVRNASLSLFKGGSS